MAVASRRLAVLFQLAVQVVVDRSYDVSLVVFGHVCRTQADEVVVVGCVDFLFSLSHLIISLVFSDSQVFDYCAVFWQIKVWVPDVALLSLLQVYVGFVLER